MYSFLNSPIKLSIIVYIFIVLLLLYNKPELLFTDDGISKGFGSNDDCEYLNLPVILYSSVIIITFVFESLATL